MNEDTAEESGEEEDKTRTNQYKGEPASTSQTRAKLVQEKASFWRKSSAGRQAHC